MHTYIHIRLYGIGHKKVTVKKNNDRANFAFRVRVRSMVQISVFLKIIIAWAI